MDLLIATGNPGKVREYRRLLADAPMNIIGLADVGLDKMDVEETGTTFEENAIIKAKAYAAAAKLWALADDSGLVVDALDGQPGVYSARFGGPGLDDAGRRKHLLEKLAGVPQEKRTGRFMCVIAVCDPTGEKIHTVSGSVEGIILEEERDSGNGFGYDPVFMPEGYDKTFGELSSEIKNRISHRGVAAVRILPTLNQIADQR